MPNEEFTNAIRPQRQNRNLNGFDGFTFTATHNPMLRDFGINNHDFVLEPPVVEVEDTALDFIGQALDELEASRVRRIESDNWNELDEDIFVGERDRLKKEFKEAQKAIPVNNDIVALVKVDKSGTKAKLNLFINKGKKNLVHWVFDNESELEESFTDRARRIKSDMAVDAFNHSDGVKYDLQFKRNGTGLNRRIDRRSIRPQDDEVTEDGLILTINNDATQIELPPSPHNRSELADELLDMDDDADFDDF